jgi:hypothetical protein
MLVLIIRTRYIAEVSVQGTIGYMIIYGSQV